MIPTQTGTGPDRLNRTVPNSFVNPGAHTVGLDSSEVVSKYQGRAAPERAHAEADGAGVQKHGSLARGRQPQLSAPA